MSTRTRKIHSSPEIVLDAIEQAGLGLKKAAVERRHNEVHITLKTFLAKRSIISYIEGEELIFTAKDDAQLGLSWKIIEAIESHLSDQGWAEARAISGKMVGEAAVRSRCLDAIDSDETVTGVAMGDVGKDPVYLLATDRNVRVLYVTAMGTGDQIIPLSKISSVEAKSGMVNASVKISTSNADIEVEKMPERHGKATADAIKRSISAAATSVHQQPAATAPSIGDIAQLSELHASGVLTDEEFSAAKAKALGL